MIVKKQVHTGTKKRKGAASTDPYVCFRPYDKKLWMNCEVRDAVLPHRWIAVEVLENLDFILHPTDDETQYKVSIISAQTSISGNKFAQYYKAGVHIPAEIITGGAILCKANEGGAIA